MTAQYRDGDSPAGANAGSRTCTIPATTQVGDLLILEWEDAGTDAGADTPPAGWVKLGDTDATNASTQGVFVYARTAQAGDAGSVVTVTADTVRRHGVAVVAYYDDAGAALSVESSVFAASLTVPSAVTVAANCFGIAGAGVRGGGGDPFTPPAGWVERIDQTTDVGSGGKNWTVADKLAYVAPGTNLGGITFTNGDTTGPASWLVVVKATPLAAPPSGTFLVL